jgi:hypothetical protein
MERRVRRGMGLKSTGVVMVGGGRGGEDNKVWGVVY